VEFGGVFGSGVRAHTRVGEGKGSVGGGGDKGGGASASASAAPPLASPPPPSLSSDLSRAPPVLPAHPRDRRRRPRGSRTTRRTHLCRARCGGGGTGERARTRRRLFFRESERERALFRARTATRACVDGGSVALECVGGTDRALRACSLGLCVGKGRACVGARGVFGTPRRSLCRALIGRCRLLPTAQRRGASHDATVSSFFWGGVRGI